MKLVSKSRIQLLLCMTCIVASPVYAGSYYYHGCYRYWVLRGDNHVTANKRMTVEMCLQTCSSTRFTHVGLRLQNNCLCANLVRPQGKLNEESCVYPCIGDRTEKCGGIFVVYSVYSKVFQSTTKLTNDVSVSTPRIQNTSADEVDMTTSTPEIESTSVYVSQDLTFSSSASTNKEITSTLEIESTDAARDKESTTSSSVCFCRCNVIRDAISWESLTENERKKVLDTLQKGLKVNVNNLSSTIRRKSSANDRRKTAAAVGYLGTAVLAVTFGLLILPDFISLFHFILSPIITRN